jgi:tRNA pseudouridine55 synthase
VTRLKFMDGVLNVDKPSGWTSHDVVAKVRGILQEKQIGHLGTLDPLATGVLPLAVGAATRLVEYAAYDKEYVATCLLGRATDSYDVTGKTLSERATTGLAPEDVRRAVLGLGKITEQVPPMVSAVKKGGKKLYELARKGVTVEREPRPVRIGMVEMIGLDLPRVRFRVVCSAGTYVRSLCQTLGEQLEVGGCMETLERVRVGPLHLKDALSLKDLEVRGKEDPSGVLLPASLLAGRLPEVKLEEKGLFDLCQGKKVKFPAPAGEYRISNASGRLCAIAEVTGEGELKPKKVFGTEGIQ